MSSGFISLLDEKRISFGISTITPNELSILENDGKFWMHFMRIKITNGVNDLKFLLQIVMLMSKLVVTILLFILVSMQPSIKVYFLHYVLMDK